MIDQPVIAALLAVAVALGWARIGWWQWHAPVRSRLWRIAALALMQPVAALFLYLTLVPPPLAGRGGVLVVATGGAPALVPTAPGERLVTLPEARGTTGAEAVPDLGTALRRHPGTQAIRVVGGGLSARDRDAAAGLSVAFVPPADLPGLVGVYPPAPVAPGAAFRIGVRIAGGGRVELVDPAGRLVDRVVPAADGQAILGATARAPGDALFTIRLMDGGRMVERAAVPVRVDPPPVTRVAIVAGAPGPEVKYLRRWATDAGLAPQVRAPLGGGAQLGAAALTPAALAKLDVVIFDDRGWAGLSAAERQAVAAAVRGGMGALLRVTGPLPPALRGQWRAMGLDAVGGQATAPVALSPISPDESALEARRGPGSADAPTALAGPRDDLPILTRRVVATGGVVPLIRDARGALLGGWRPGGRGRVGLWTVEDSFALVTAGHGDRYAEWWSAMLSAVARPDGRLPARFDPLPRAGERTAICDLPPGATVRDPAGRRTTLLPDAAAGGCAGYWPAQAGWHRVSTGQAIYVQPADALPVLRAAARRDATSALAGQSHTGRVAAPSGERGSPWPWFMGWLAAAALTWWLERARFGRTGGQAG